MADSNSNMLFFPPAVGRGIVGRGLVGRGVVGQAVKAFRSSR